MQVSRPRPILPGASGATSGRSASMAPTLCYDAAPSPHAGPSTSESPFRPRFPEARPVTLIISAVQHPIEFGVATLVAAGMVYVFLRAAMSAERRQLGWVATITGPNGKLFFSLLFVAWALAFGIGLQLVPHTGANSPYGGLAFIGLISGFFIMMGFLWSVIGE